MRVLVASLIFLWSLPLAAEWYNDQQDIMGTRISVNLWHEDAAIGNAAVKAVMTEMRRIDAQYSPYIESSQLSRINRDAPKASAAEPVQIPAELSEILQKSLYYGRLTGGAFDITFASLGRYYDYRAGQKPNKEQQQTLLPVINYRHVKLDSHKHTVYFDHPQVYLDLGGIAKGYAVDRAIDIVQKMGVVNASVSAGGDSRVIGNKLGRPWLVGIKNPRSETGVAITVPLEDCAISTSGDYERYFIDDEGTRVHHILNPRTGQSASGIASVSVIGPLGFDTDPLSTSVFVLGVEKGLALIDGLPNYDAIIITTDGKVHYSAGLAPP